MVVVFFLDHLCDLLEFLLVSLGEVGSDAYDKLSLTK
jgi:hypothetical protein